MKPQIHDVPETMLWTLHNRATEASRVDGMIEDPDAVRIYRAIDYDYERSFGAAEASHAVRSAMFDGALRSFLAKAPKGVIVNLGEGLETQRFRLARSAPEALWLSVDLASAIALRERFIEPDENHRHVSSSVLDRQWFGEVSPDRPVFITAQGLFMYLGQAQVRRLLIDLAASFPGAWLMFDTIPRWLSRKTLSARGWRKTPHYTTPRMPWGIDRHELVPTLEGWVPSLAEVAVDRWSRFPRGAARWLFPAFQAAPLVGRYAPAIVRLRFAEG